MSQERVSEIRDLLFQLEGKMRPLQWDADKNQINPFKKAKLEGFISERDGLLDELNNLSE